MAPNLTVPQIHLPASDGFDILRSRTSLTSGEIESCLAAVFSTMGKPFDTRIDALEALVNMMCIAYPPFIDTYSQMKSLNIKVVDLAKDTVLSAFGAGLTDQMSAVPRLPLVDPVNPDTFVNQDTIPIFCGLAVVLFTLGKNIDRGSTGQFTDQRPKALIGKYSLTDHQQVYLPTRAYGPSTATLVQLSEAFTEYPEVRATTARLLLSQLNAEFVPPSMQCILTAFKLLRGAQLAHAQAISECCIANPWIVKISELRPGLSQFASDLIRLNAMPEDSRWFVRLLSTDNNTLFNRANMRPLAAVAVNWKKRVEPTFAAYAGDDSAYASVIATFDYYLAQRVVQTTGADSLFAALGLPETDLPTAQVTPSTTARIV